MPAKALPGKRSNSSESDCSFSRSRCIVFKNRMPPFCDGRLLYQIRSRLSTRFLCHFLVSLRSTVFAVFRGGLLLYQSRSHLSTLFSCHFLVSHQPTVFAVLRRKIIVSNVIPFVNTFFRVTLWSLIYQSSSPFFATECYCIKCGLVCQHVFSCHFLAALDQSLPTFLRRNVILTNMKAFVNTNFQANT